MIVTKIDFVSLFDIDQYYNYTVLSVALFRLIKDTRITQRKGQVLTNPQTNKPQRYGVFTEVGNQCHQDSPYKKWQVRYSRCKGMAPMFSSRYAKRMNVIVCPRSCNC